MENMNQWLPLLIPIIVLQLALMIFALIDLILVRYEMVKPSLEDVFLRLLGKGESAA